MLETLLLFMGHVHLWHPLMTRNAPEERIAFGERGSGGTLSTCLEFPSVRCTPTWDASRKISSAHTSAAVTLFVILTNFPPDSH